MTDAQDRPSNTGTELKYLTELPPGVLATVRAVEAGHNCSQRLAAMGILPGADIRVVRGCQAGPVIVEVVGSRFALGCGMARRVKVELPL